MYDGIEMEFCYQCCCNGNVDESNDKEIYWGCK